MVRRGKKYSTSCSVVAYGKVGCYDVGRCYGGHCYESWPLCNYLVRAGGRGGIRPSSHQDSASKTPSVYGVMWPSMVFCQAVWFILLVSREIFNYSLYYCIFNCVNCRRLPTQSEADLPLEAHLQNPWIASLLKPLQNPALSDLPFIEPTHVGRMMIADIKGAILPW